jgi:hypothetical protein
MRKNNDTLYILIGAAVVGYMAYKQGVFNKGPINAPSAMLPGQTQGGIQSVQNSMALESPSFADTGIIAPKQIDPTGEQITFF